MHIRTILSVDIFDWLVILNFSINAQGKTTEQYYIIKMAKHEFVKIDNLRNTKNNYSSLEMYTV